jgi:hypothetical protein
MFLQGVAAQAATLFSFMLSQHPLPSALHFAQARQSPASGN